LGLCTARRSGRVGRYMQHDGAEPGTPADWVRHARSDLAVATQRRQREVLPATLCFHAQQAVEKSLKAVLIHREIEPPYTHDIARLITAVKELGVAWPEELGDAVNLTRYAAQTRYPGTIGPVTEEHYEEAARVARAVVQWAERTVAQTC